MVKREPGGSSGLREEAGERSTSGQSREGAVERRILRSRYLAVKNLISDDREDIGRGDSDRFSSIITEVENLHQLVQKPREQVADAEALLDIANTLVTSVKSQRSDGLSPSDFVSALLLKFGLQDGNANNNFVQNVISWADVGFFVSHVFMKVPGCCTMNGPMDNQLRQRKPMINRKRTRPAESTRPEELAEAEPGSAEKSDTDRNMSTMFDILRRRKSVKMENLVLNRLSFAQTVENIFALSFLVKDGRAEITVNDAGYHLVSPRNAPAATSVASGDVSYSHFVFRFDTKDWKLMLDVVGKGEELMPHRTNLGSCGATLSEAIHDDSQSGAPSTPIRKLTRNRGLVIQEESTVDDTPKKDSSGEEFHHRQKGKRRNLGI
ncbi:non-structural maintenance of chromosomes element 4 homolog A-like [Typha latifolia]|uniref:non-structural maintenance of chromosomes element 4 homolog A-like n=1 Tax=Typha latifolia TaxID=4733 RepID=UPI003C2B204C